MWPASRTPKPLGNSLGSPRGFRVRSSGCISSLWYYCRVSQCHKGLLFGKLAKMLGKISQIPTFLRVSDEHTKRYRRVFHNHARPDHHVFQIRPCQPAFHGTSRSPCPFNFGSRTRSLRYYRLFLDRAAHEQDVGKQFKGKLRSLSPLSDVITQTTTLRR